MILEEVDGEFKKMSNILNDGNNPLKKVQVITNHPNARQYFIDLMKKYGIPGEVIVLNK